jgi:Ni/Fe-hydrogenase 1 B-type cytochrome subunit
MKKWRFDFRIWHWVNAAVVLGLLGTVFLRETFLNFKMNKEIIIQKLAELNIEATAAQIKALTKAITSPLWEWHIILGYVLAVLIVWRIALFFTQSGQESFLHFKQATLHKKIVKLGYLGIYTVLLFMAVSGLMMEFHKELGLSNALNESLEELHDLVYNAVLIFVPLHIIGVVIAEMRDEKGIISDMVYGGSKD